MLAWTSDLLTAQHYQILPKNNAATSEMPNSLIFPYELACGEWRHFSWNFISYGFIEVIGARFKEMLGKTACKHEVEYESWENAITVEIANHQKIPSEMAFCVWWHLSGNFVLQNRRGQGENIEQNHYGNHWNIEKVIVAILSFAIVSRRNSIFEAIKVILRRSNDRRIGRKP